MYERKKTFVIICVCTIVTLFLAFRRPFLIVMWSSVVKTVIIFMYCFLTLGIAANIVVLGMIVKIMRTLKDDLSDKSMFIYLLTLNIIDTCVLSNLPLIVLDIINGQWILSDFLCKVHYLSDNLNKVMSTMILVVLSFDRYLTVCHPNYVSALKTTKVTFAILVTILLFCIILLSPLIFSTGLAVVHLDSKTTIVKCSYLEMNFDFEYYFFYTLLIFGFCIPFLLILIFHGAILAKIRSNENRLRRSSLVMERKRSNNFVTRKIIILVTFYFVCWAPYWVYNLHVQLTASPEIMLNETNTRTPSEQALHFTVQQTSIWLPTLGLLLHIMVYANSAFNPFIYGLLNYELRRQYNRASEKVNRLASARQSLTTLPNSRAGSRIDLDGVSSLLVRIPSQKSSEQRSSSRMKAARSQSSSGSSALLTVPEWQQTMPTSQMAVFSIGDECRSAILKENEVCPFVFL